MIICVLAYKHGFVEVVWMTRRVEGMHESARFET